MPPVALESLGFDPFFAGQLTPEDRAEGLLCARVVAEEKVTYRVRAADHQAPHGAQEGEFWADLAGKFRHRSEGRQDVPTVGDWVLVRPPHSAASRGHIQKLLDRKSYIARTSDRGALQPLAANVDVAFIAASLNNEFNVRRIERYLALIHKSGAQPVVVLTKADLVDDPAPWVQEVQAIAPQVPVHAVSAVAERGLAALQAMLGVGKTAVLLGSSGVGKSTLTNVLCKADLQWMMEIREFDDKGRHCTTRRNLFLLPLPPESSGGMIIDTPGLRGLMLSEATDAVAATFEDVEALATRCRFTNCRHETEPGCAIRAEVEAGRLEADRVAAYLKLQREVAFQTRTRADIQKHKESLKKRTVWYNKTHKNR